VVAAAQIAVAPEDLPDPHAGEPVLRDVPDEPGELA
jgi:hypothetical protein